ncbi:hypothetical protein [Bosea sp. (in: a-proteobacteria)]|uniref:hypothetical protein n=1 Tax=Bosea sp. (in: a-proteobacteria) TaxID=1871050 RepID=UPI001ACC4947|nr:hypothetical protein [Bosea sp. (in: a-proteobacteria)]MBN9440587.1 hypothetical protein [Bosea sp. (in: a-proteobacteria)]
MSLRLRQVAPDAPDNFVVMNDHGDTIGRISRDRHVPVSTPPWSWSLSAYRYRHRPDYAGRCETVDDAKAAVKERWPGYLAELEYDGVLERLRRERLGVPTRMFIYEDEREAAPAQIEALAGCLEGTIEEARLSLLVEALTQFEERPRPLCHRVAADLAQRDRAMWPSSRVWTNGDRRPSL